MDMTSEERDQLQQFLRPLAQSRALSKDPVAESLIRQAFANHPDALYILVQRAMASDLALQAAKNHPSTPATSTAFSPWSSGLLGAMVGTTVGVVAGAILLDGIEDILDASMD